MITLEDLKNPTKAQYLDKAISYSIALIGTISISNINDLNDIIKRYQAEVLSSISVLTTHIKFMINNFANMQKDIYFKEIINNINYTRNINKNILLIDNLNAMLNTIKTNVSSYREDVEELYVVPYDSLSIYENTPTENSLNLVKSKYTEPNVFLYHSGKLLLNDITSILNNYSNKSSENSDNESSIEETFLNKSINMLILKSENIQESLYTNNILELLDDSCFVAKVVYTEYNFTDETRDLFLKRKYSKIKADIMEILLNNL